MATSLRSRLGDLASAFAARVVAAIRESSLEELFAQSSARSPSSSRAAPAAHRSGGGRLARRSEGDIAAVIDQIVELLRQHPKGLRAEEIRAALGLESKEMPRPIKEGLEAGRFTRSGHKRATTYLAKGAKRASPGKRRKRAKAAARKVRASKRAKPSPKKEAVVSEAPAPPS
jgi:hypothetical protein